MSINRKALLAFLRDEAEYKGAADFAEIEKFVKAENIVIKDEDGNEIDIKEAWDTPATLAVKTAKVDDTEDKAGDSEEVRQFKKWKRDQQAAKRAGENPIQKAHGEKVTTNTGTETFHIRAQRKAYEAKIAANDAKTHCTSVEEAEVAGAWAKMLTFKRLGVETFDGQNECKEILAKANVSYDFGSGGFAVPDVLKPNLINIRARYSALPQLVNIQPIDPAGESVPRRTGGVTVYSPAEGVAATESNPAGDQVKLTPFEMVTLSTVSRTQLQRSIIDFGNFVMGEHQYAIAKKLEEIYILGDGSTTYFSQRGLIGKLNSNIIAAGGAVGTNEDYNGATNAVTVAWSSLTYDHIMQTAAKVLDMENAAEAKWLCSWPFWMQVLLPLARSKGGVTTPEIINGMPTYRWEGFPVVLSNAMQTQSTDETYPLFFGDFNIGSKVGVVPGSMEMSVSTERYWDARKVGYQMAVHHAVNVHDFGVANSTAASRSGGPIAALYIDY